MFEIRFAVGVATDLRKFRAIDRERILSAVNRKLAYEPTKRTKQIKQLRKLVPPFESVPSIWQLRIGDYRVFYDVDLGSQKVFVRAVRRKPPQRRTENIL